MAETATAPASSGSFAGFLNLEFGRQLGLMVGLAASVAVGVAVALWSMNGDYKPLYGSLERIDSANVIDVLTSSDIDYRIDQRSGALLVAGADIQRARLKLAAAGMPSDRNIGFEILDKEQPLGTSQFMETARYRRSLEGELARTISSIAAVRSARVHLAIPKSTVFLRDQREPRASVFIEAFQGRRVSDDQGQAIANLIVSSVPELSLRNVTVVDQRGNLLSDFSADPKYAEAARQNDYVRQVEMDILQRVNSLLEPILGGEKFRAEVAAELDFTEREQTAEIYNPDLPAIRSEQTSTEQTSGDETAGGGVPGALSNQPPAGGSTEAQVDPETGAPIASGRSRAEATRNYELDRTISHTRHQVGKVMRLTVAVAVDDLAPAGSSDGEKQPWQAAELERMTLLVQNAVGYDAARGDKVSVVNTPFLRVEPEQAPLAEPPLWQQDWFLSIINKVLGVLGFLLLVFLVLRPTLKNLVDGSKKIRDLEAKHQAALKAVNEVAAGAEAVVGADGSVTLTGAANNLLPSPTDALDKKVDLVRNMINDDPERVAQVVQGWSGNE